MNEFNSAPSEAKASEGYRRNFIHDVRIVMLSSLLMLMFVYLDDFVLAVLRAPNGLPAVILSAVDNMSLEEAAEMVTEFSSSDMFLNILGVIAQLLMLAVAGLTARKLMVSKPKKIFPLKAVLPSRAISFVGLTFGMCYTVNLVCTLLFGNFYPNIGALSMTDNAFSFVSIVIIAPIFEELVFRGIFFRSLARYDRVFAIIFTAVIFGLMHRNPSSIINAVVFGMFAAISCAETGSLLMGIILHMTNNAISYCATSILSLENSAVLLLIPLSLFTIAMIGSAISMGIEGKVTGIHVVALSRPAAHDTPRLYASTKVKAIVGCIWTWLFAALLGYSIWLLYV